MVQVDRNVAQAPGPRVLVTGAAGFVGTPLCRRLGESGFRVRRAVRTAEPGAAVDTVAVGDIGPDTDWRAALADVQCVIHLAARTHVLHETATDPLAEYRRVNLLGTERLVRAASTSGVLRFVFLSSIKVNGEATGTRPFTESDAPAPEDAYGVTKREAEEALARHAAASGLDLVVLRPPLVYGAGVKGNFLRLMRLVARGVPLPLGSVRNARSLIFVDNLADAIRAVIIDARAAGNTYLVSDGEDVSTPELVRLLANAMNSPARLLPCPIPMLAAAAALLGKRVEARRLIGSLQIDSSKIRLDLGWTPPFRLVEGLRRTAQWYDARVGARSPLE